MAKKEVSPKLPQSGRGTQTKRRQRLGFWGGPRGERPRDRVWERKSCRKTVPNLQRDGPHGSPTETSSALAAGKQPQGGGAGRTISRGHPELLGLPKSLRQVRSAVRRKKALQ